MRFRPLLALAPTVACVGRRAGDAIDDGPSFSVRFLGLTTDTAGTVAALVAVIVVLGFVFYLTTRPPTPPRAGSDDPAGSAGRGVWRSVRGVSLALDANGRADLLASLAAASSSHDLLTVHGRHAAAQATVALLRAAVGSARLGSVVGKSLAPRAAQRSVAAVIADLRARDADAVAPVSSPNAGPAFRAGGLEPANLFVVSVFTVAATHFVATPATPDRAALTAAIDHLVPSDPHALVDFEVVCSPAAEGAAFALDAIAAAHPELYTLVDRPS
jgi:uncharacterized membrane protein